jgi:hypothetical protein
VALFDSLAGGRSSDTVRIGVAFRTLALADSHQVLGVCPSPKIGNATAAGSDDAVSRFRGLHLFGVFPLGLEQQKSGVRRDPRGCHAEKKTLPNLFTLKHAFPEHAQVSVIRIGDLLLGTLPGEPTTMAGAAASEAMLGAAAAGGRPASVAVVLSLTNGFINYITTAAEYSAQTYEGGSTLYGPNEGAMFARELGRLSALLAERRVASAPATADSVLVYPGDIRTLVPEKGPPSIERRILEIRCRGDTVVTRWVDLHPSRFRASDGLVLEWQRRVNGGWTRAAVDDDPYVEVRFTGTKRRGGWVWESRWTPPDEPGPYRFMLLPRLGMEGLSSPGCPRRASVATLALPPHASNIVQVHAHHLSRHCSSQGNHVRRRRRGPCNFAGPAVAPLRLPPPRSRRWRTPCARASAPAAWATASTVFLS